MNYSTFKTPTKSYFLPFFVHSSQTTMSLIDNSNQTYGGQSIYECTLKRQR